MASVACSRCGHVPAFRAQVCPACGAPSDETLLARPSALAPARIRRPQFVEVEGRIVLEPDRMGWTRVRRKRVVEFGVAGALIIVVVLVIVSSVDPALLGFGSGTRTDVILPAGTMENLTGGNPLSWHEFQTEHSGTLRGSFTISGGFATVYVCNATQYSRFDGFGPLGKTWASGLVQGGTLTTQLAAGETYFVGGWPEAQNGTSVWAPTPLILTWTSPLDFDY